MAFQLFKDNSSTNNNAENQNNQTPPVDNYNPLLTQKDMTLEQVTVSNFDSSFNEEVMEQTTPTLNAPPLVSTNIGSVQQIPTVVVQEQVHNNLSFPAPNSTPIYPTPNSAPLFTNNFGPTVNQSSFPVQAPVLEEPISINPPILEVQNEEEIVNTKETDETEKISKLLFSDNEPIYNEDKDQSIPELGDSQFESIVDDESKEVSAMVSELLKNGEENNVAVEDDSTENNIIIPIIPVPIIEEEKPEEPIVSEPKIEENNNITFNNPSFSFEQNVVPLPEGYKRCPKCGQKMRSDYRQCFVCGTYFPEN